MKLSHLLVVIALTLVSCQTLAASDKRAEPSRINTPGTKATTPVAAIDSSAFSQFPEKIESKYFIFYSAIPLPKLQRYAHFSDLFLDVVDHDFISLNVTRKVNAVVLPSPAEFQRYLIQLNVNIPPAQGVYLPEKNLFVTYDGTGLGTFSHEIMHYVVESVIPGRPSWAAEGIPAFFEKFYGYEEDGKLQLKWGFQNPWRIQALGERIPKLRIFDIMYGSEDTSEQRLLSVFLYQQGKLKTFLDLIRQGDKKGFRNYVEAAFDKPIYDIENDWQFYLSAINAKRDQILKLPSSQYFPTAQEFVAFEKENSSVLQNYKPAVSDLGLQ